MSEELKPCPFCGGEAERMSDYYHELVVCPECDFSGLFEHEWNTRADHIPDTSKMIAEAIAKLKEQQSNTDLEMAHGVADDVLCDLLEKLGYGDVVDEYSKVDKWYA